MNDDVYKVLNRREKLEDLQEKSGEALQLGGGEGMDEVIDVIKDNVDKVLDRGEKLEDLQEGHSMPTHRMVAADPLQISLPIHS